jgi:hypothetical protein
MNTRLRAIAAANSGVFTIGDARACGFSDEQVERFLRVGQLTRLRRGTYAETAVINACNHAQRHALDVVAAQRRVNRPTVASHLSALLLHGVPLLDPPRGVALTSDVGRPKTYDGVSLSVASLPTSHLYPGRLYGVETVSLARALVDVARTRPMREALVPMDAALARLRVTKGELRDCLAACDDWPGATAALRVIEFAEPKTESPAESLSRVMFVEYDIEMPEPQVWVYDGDVPIYRLDFYWRRHRVIGEVDGRVKLESGDPNVLWEEKRREDYLREDDRDMVRWSYGDVRYRAARTAARVRAKLARAERRWAG